jgi:hypothetical protein
VDVYSLAEGHAEIRTGSNAGDPTINVNAGRHLLGSLFIGSTAVGAVTVIKNDRRRGTTRNFTLRLDAYFGVMRIGSWIKGEEEGQIPEVAAHEVYLISIFCSKRRKNMSSLLRAVNNMYQKEKGSSVAIWYIFSKVFMS